VRKETERWTKVVKAAGLGPEQWRASQWRASQWRASQWRASQWRLSRWRANAV